MRTSTITERSSLCSGADDLQQELAELVNGFVERLRARRDALLLILRRGDNATALRLLHQLEGSSAMYGLMGVSTHSGEIRRAIDGNDYGTAIRLTESLCDSSFILTT